VISDFVLNKKRSRDQEYTLHLFEKCNLSCKFCWQDHNAFEGVQTVREKAKYLIDMLSVDGNLTFTVNIMGGEIFADDIFDDKLSDDYLYVCTQVSDFVLSQKKTIVFNFVTNLVNNRKLEIEALLMKIKKLGIKANLVASYDPRGRFDQKNLELYKNNISFFSDKISCISMLITKPLIKLLMSTGDSYFDYLYKANFYIYFDYYSPANDYKMMMPTDDEMFIFFKFLIDKYPNVNPIREWIENEINLMSCRSSKLLLQDGTQCMCGNLVKENKSINQLFDAEIKKDNNDSIELHFLQKYNCLECQYFNKCTLGCFIKHSFSDRSSSGECPFKSTFAYIEQKSMHLRNL